MKIEMDGMVYDAVLQKEALPAYQVTDKASINLIRACIGDCRNQTVCEISVKYNGGTLAGTSSYYDAEGILCINDTNRSEYQATCKTCGKSWLIKQYPK